MKRRMIFFTLIIFTSLVFASKPAVLPEILKPETILVDNGKIFITQGIHIYIYSLKDFKLQKKFGKQGQGPQEFQKIPAPWIPSLYVFFKPGQLFVNSFGKVSIFTREGNFSKEINTGGLVRVFIPFGEKYIGVSTSRENNVEYVTYNLHDSQLKRETEVFRIKNPQQPGKKLDPVVMGMIKNFFFRYTDKKHFCIPAADGGMHVFSGNGKEVCSFMPDYQKVKLNQEKQNKFDQFFSTDIRFKRIYAMDRNNVELPDALPLLKDYRVTDDKIYIISNKKEKNKYESFIYDFKGKLIKKVWLPLIDLDMLELYPFTIREGKIYQLVENDEEEWELRVTGI